MLEDDHFDFGEEQENPGAASDPAERDAVERLRRFFKAHPDEVFFSRQLEVRHEDDYFHWVTNRALRELRGLGVIQGETRSLRTGGSINLVWPRSYRFYRRSASRVVRLVEEYADPNIGAAIGLHGEGMVLEGFARSEFVMRGRNTREFRGRVWTASEHNLDFIFEREGRAYGVEVKNTLSYMDYTEFRTKIEVCRFLGIIPVFAVRMLPKSWINEVVEAGGFGLILKYQLYPWGHRELAKRVAKDLGLPVDSPRALSDGTMKRFLAWHQKQL